jgi:hypothetical protein
MALFHNLPISLTYGFMKCSWILIFASAFNLLRNIVLVKLCENTKTFQPLWDGLWAVYSQGLSVPTLRTRTKFQGSGNLLDFKDYFRFLWTLWWLFKLHNSANGNGFVLIKLYLQNHAAGWICTMGQSVNSCDKGHLNELDVGSLHKKFVASHGNNTCTHIIVQSRMKINVMWESSNKVL